MSEIQKEYDVSLCKSTQGRSLTDTSVTISDDIKTVAGLASVLEKIRQTVMHHADAFAEWLDLVTLDDTPIFTPLLSMTARPLANTAPALACGITAHPDVLAREIVASFFSILHLDPTVIHTYDPRSASRFTSAHLAITDSTMERLQLYCSTPHSSPERSPGSRKAWSAESTTKPSPSLTAAMAAATNGDDDDDEI